MTARQERFIREYLVDLCASKAARRAGYSIKNARSIGCRLLRHPEIQGKVAKAMEAEKASCQLRREQVLEELKTVAFAPASDASGAELKVAQKLKALELLGKHLGMFGSREEPVVEENDLLERLMEDMEDMDTDDLSEVQ
jgi:phage terminase small subunit